MLAFVMRVVCVALCLYELRDMVYAARDVDGPFGLRAACILADGAIMFAVTQFCWWGTF